MGWGKKNIFFCTFSHIRPCKELLRFLNEGSVSTGWHSDLRFVLLLEENRCIQKKQLQWIESDPHTPPSSIIKSPPTEESTTPSVQHSEDESGRRGGRKKKKTGLLWSRISSTSSGISEYKLCILQTCRCPTGPAPSLSYTPTETNMDIAEEPHASFSFAQQCHVNLLQVSKSPRKIQFHIL